MTSTDTIFALSSGHGKSGVAVVRISGADLETEFANLVRLSDFIQPRHAYLTNLADADGNIIDQCVAIYFKSPASFTGEDVIEIHCHGAPAVVQKIFDFLTTRDMRMAAAGEFSRRAFYNNKMDLTEIDGLVALLDARTDKQRIAALKSMTGADSAIYDAWRAQMVEIAAYAAAILDYSADELPADIGKKLSVRTKKLYEEINAALSGYSKSRIIRGGFNIALVGDVNVGKSSIFNRLVGSARAIVSDIPGTTRDVVSSELDIDGYLVHLSDTAGLRASDDAIEKIGIERTHAEMENADLVLRVYGCPTPDTPDAADNEIIIFNKCDLDKSKSKYKNAISVSAATGTGIDKLLDTIKQKIHDALDGAESDIAINARTRGLLQTAANELFAAVSMDKDNYDIFAEHVRAAADNIGKILGTIDAAEVADATFAQLCLGK